MGLLLLRIFGPQLAGLAAYAALRLSLRRAPMFAQLGAVLLTAAASVYISAWSLQGAAHIGAFIALQIFVSLLAQLLIVAAQE